MKPEEKVVLTGEGADELFFGYDRIFRTFLDTKYKFDLNTFINLYGYSKVTTLTRFFDWIETLKANKNNIEFLEDFFLQFHLTGLLKEWILHPWQHPKKQGFLLLTKI